MSVAHICCSGSTAPQGGTSIDAVARVFAMAPSTSGTWCIVTSQCWLMTWFWSGRRSPRKSISNSLSEIYRHWINLWSKCLLWIWFWMQYLIGKLYSLTSGIRFWWFLSHLLACHTKRHTKHKSLVWCMLFLFIFLIFGTGRLWLAIRALNGDQTCALHAKGSRMYRHNKIPYFPHLLAMDF